MADQLRECVRAAGFVGLWLGLAAAGLSQTGLAQTTSLAQTPGLAQTEEFPLRGDETIVFFGDSITQGGAYVEYVDAFLATRFPEKRFRILNSGISSETISGTSETDHNPRRPHALPRFERDVAAHRPQIVVACFGMNDGNYHPFESSRFQKYQTGMRILQDKTAAAGAKLFLLTPPPFDPYRRGAGDPNAKEFGYKFAAIDYDATLEAYSDWLLLTKDAGWTAFDVHGAMNRHLQRRRRDQVSFHLSPDAVHPNPTGHWLMAQTLLLGWHAPALVEECVVDAEKLQGLRGPIRDVKRADATLSWTWTSKLPLPRDPRWDEVSLEVEQVTQRLNQYTLTVLNLPAGRYELTANDRNVGIWTAAELAQGIDLNRVQDFPTHARASELLSTVQQRRRQIYQAWRKGIQSDPIDAVRPTQAAETETAPLAERIRTLAQPQPIALRLSPAKSE